MNKASIATYYKDFPLKKPETRLTGHELDLYYAVMEVKIEHDRQALAEFNPNLNVWEAVNLARSKLTIEVFDSRIPRDENENTAT